MSYIKHRSDESLEDYLETILSLQNKHGQVRSIDIANEMNFSKPSVSVAMKNLREKNYMNYRINRSKILLRSTNKSIAEIAEACGFSDTSNFISQFKKHTGIRPTHYRKDFL